MTLRPLPPATVPDLLLGSSRHPLIVYARIESRVMVGGLYMVADSVAHEIEGVTYDPVGFAVSPLPEGEDGQPVIELALPNVARAVGEALRRAGEDTRVTLTWRHGSRLDLSATPRVLSGADRPLLAIDRWRVIDIMDADASSVSMRLSRPDISQEPAAPLRATPDIAPGLWL